MKNRYEVKTTIDKEARDSGFCDTIEQAQLAASILQMMCEIAERAYTISIIDTETNETKCSYKG